MAFFQISNKYEDQGHPRSNYFEGLRKGYPLVNFHNSAVNSVRDIANVTVCHGRTDRRQMVIILTHFVYTHEPKVVARDCSFANVCFALPKF